MSRLWGHTFWVAYQTPRAAKCLKLVRCFGGRTLLGEGEELVVVGSVANQDPAEELEFRGHVCAVAVAPEQL